MRERRAELDAAGISVFAVGFSPPAALALLADHLAWPWPFLSDPERLLYRRLALPRVGPLQVYSAGTLLRYARAALAGRPLSRPVEDTRQLGGDAVVQHGSALAVFRPRTPNDRIPVHLLVARALRYGRPGAEARRHGDVD